MRPLIIVLLLALSAPAAAQTARYFVNDTTNVIEAYTESDRVAAPAGTTAVLVSTIKAATTGKVLQGGTWDGTTYSPPVGVLNAASVDHRRRELARMLKENWLPYASAALKGSDLIKLSSQINAILRAIAVDANMTTDAHYDVLHAEASISGATFLRYAGDQWTNLTDGYYSVLNDHFPTGGNWALHTIHQAVNAGTATNAATAGTESPMAVITTAAAQFNWPVELFKLAAP